MATRQTPKRRARTKITKKSKRPAKQYQPKADIAGFGGHLKEVNEELYKRNSELAVRNKTLSLLGQLYEISILTLEPEELAARVAMAIRTTLNFESVAIFSFDEKTDKLTSLNTSRSERLQQVWSKIRPEVISPVISSVSQEPFLKQVIIKRQVGYTHDVYQLWRLVVPQTELKRLQEEVHHIKTSLVYPLMIGSRVIGVLLFNLNRDYSDLNQFEKESISSFVNVIALALDKTFLYKQLQITNSELTLANQKLEDLSRQKTEFVSIASHQLRSPLTAIKGYSSMILEGSYGEIPGEVKRVLGIIFESSQRLASVIQDFLDVTRIELGKMDYQISEFSLKELVSKIVTELKQSIENKGLRLAVNLPDDPCQIKADAGKISQVVGNLIDNANKYTPRGSVTITLTKTGDKYRLEIADTGVGISAETLPKLFQKFSRAPGATMTNMTSTGLGLYVAKEITEAHKGKVWAESDGTGKGSRFIVELPATN